MTARSVNKIDIQRRASEEALKERELQLMELNATKDKFFNIVAHDLKNPFTSLLGSSELLYHNIGNLETENIRELALILNDSAKSGYAILQNLLDWSRSQTGLLKINPERVNLRNLIHENISTLQLAATNKEILILNEVKEDFFVFSDKNMINTILRNLLSNAVKYTYNSGQVRVSTTITTDEAIVSVKDTGIGIPANIIEKLFKIESRNSIPGTENEQGTGLGLKLSKEFVEKLGGRIWVESIENKGSEFRFSIVSFT
jgi:signal transduction histidine kinase